MRDDGRNNGAEARPVPCQEKRRGSEREKKGQLERRTIARDVLRMVVVKQSMEDEEDEEEDAAAGEECSAACTRSSNRTVLCFRDGLSDPLDSFVQSFPREGAARLYVP